MNSLVQYVVESLVLGCIYGLISVSYTVIYGVVGLVNFAYGSLFMLGGFFTLLMARAPGLQLLNSSTTGAGLAIGPAFVVGVSACGLLGLLIDRLIYRRLREAPMLTTMICSFAILIGLEYLGEMVFGSADYPFPSLVSGTALRISGSVVSWAEFTIVGVTVGTMLLLAGIVRWTQVGRALRSIAENRRAAAVCGVPVERLIGISFFFGTALAGVAGVMYFSYFNVVSASGGEVPGLFGLTGAILGGIGDIPGALIGGLMIGTTLTLSGGVIPNGSAYANVIVFALLIVVLWLRPTGVLGRAVEARS